jgi:hypothetical protein
MNQRQKPSLPSRLRRQAENTVDRLVQNNFRATKARYQSRCARNDRRFGGQAPLLIYTMGKVGSSSVLHSLKLLDLDRPLYHLHSLAPEPLRELESELEPAFPDPQALVSLHHVWRCQYALDTLARHPEHRIQAISLIRDPLARNLSNFFQHIHVEPLPDAAGVQRWQLVSSFYDFKIIASEDDVSACESTTPVCDVAEGTCVACTRHEQCPQSACHLEEGSCLPTDRVWWVDGDAGGCATADGSEEPAVLSPMQRASCLLLNSDRLFDLPEDLLEV